MRRIVLSFLAVVFASASFFLGALPAPAADASAPDAYAQFVAGAQAQRGLFTLWRKNGEVYVDIAPGQLDTDFLETIVPGNGMGADAIIWGNTDHLPAMLLRFERAGNGIALLWPNSSFIAPGSASGSLAVGKNFPRSVVGIGKIVAENGSHIVFDASPLFDDVLDFDSVINSKLHTTAASRYHLDRSRTYFGSTKAFPENVVIDVEQLWATETPHVAPDTAPDARSVQMEIVYNFAQLPHDTYRPRFADNRIGIYDDVYLDFSPSRDETPDRYVRYIVRWNFAPADPSRPSPATHPMVFYLSDTIPQQYRGAIRDAVLRWNQAFERIGILDAIEVKDQPSDPNWDPDDIRYNVLRWVTEERASFGADSQTLFDPRTGEEFRTGILISADSAAATARSWRTIVDPVRYGRDTDPVPRQFVYDSFQAEIMHETGHNLGLQHNFIGSMAYTAKDLQSPAFTAKYGVTSTVMEYAPINIWPRPYGQGSYYQTVLGPYDYYAIRYAYAAIPGADSPEAELPALRRWASGWSDPRYRYASDEDTSWADGHAADPRAEKGDLTNDPLSWATVQMQILLGLMNGTPQRLPHAGGVYEDATRAFAAALLRYLGDATTIAHYIGGQYLSRAHRGDPGAEPPIVPVPLATQERALGILDAYLFSSRPFDFSPQVLDTLGYSEWAGYGYVGWGNYGNLPLWAYDPPLRHDYPVVEVIGRAQKAAIDQIFQPAVLQRLDENPSLSTAPTLTLDDLFTRMQHVVYRELDGHPIGTIPLLRRNLQMTYAQTLVALSSDTRMPWDARAFAKRELARLHTAATAAMRTGSDDSATQAHLSALAQMTPRR